MVGDLGGRRGGAGAQNREEWGPCREGGKKQVKARGRAGVGNERKKRVRPFREEAQYAWACGLGGLCGTQAFQVLTRTSFHP